MTYILDMNRSDILDGTREVRECAVVDFGATLLELAEYADMFYTLHVTDARGVERGTYYFDAEEGRFILACQMPYPANWYTPDTDADLFNIDDEDIII